ncbi:phage tail protein [Citrobacter freundii]|uniref:phage tail-collar fiber domain-containing protein n=1 Tax=Citrobacter freundii TaxID=546 RepID=UPI00259DEAB3|nr:phage tail protein [Citrobacter freundii]EIJ8980748.1 phage tail protein [Citrobacter freundii]EJD5387344.1 phage tail protein [Citrobacter freundii]EJG9717372.1 phage tail protein [Citrobacter freundii]EJK5503120.1 phage tail protein [Citrobacter freundii]
MSQAVITKVFSEWKAQQAINNQPVTLDEFIFAYIPGLDTDKPIDNTETIPAADKIVDRLPVSKTGVVNENSVVYSVTLGADVGDYDFNWIGLANKATGTLAMIIHAPTQRKIKNANGQQGNVLVRSMLMEYSGARETTEITTPAETWQIDFTARLAAMDERQRRENIDLYGTAAFFDSGYLVAKTGNQFFVTKGAGYVAGLRAELPADLNINASAKPTKVWLDVSWTGTLTSEWAVQSKITVAADLADYVLGGVQHYVFAVASIDAAGNITDLRPKGTLNEQQASDALKKHEQSRNHPDATTNEKGFTRLSSATDSTSEELAATSKAVKIAMDNANARLAKERNGADIPNPPLFVQNIGLQETVNKADGALQKDQNGADVPQPDWFVRNIGAARAFNGGINIGGGGEWWTPDLISWLENQGAFNHPYWMCKGAWSYANNRVITDTGCGNIQLAGAVIEVMGHRGAMTIRVTTATAGAGTLGTQFTYTNHGDDYSPGWRRDFNTTNKPTSEDVGALPITGGTVSGNLGATGIVQAGNSKKFALSSENTAAKNANFNLWGSAERPVVIEMRDELGWHFYSQRNTDGSITLSINGQVTPSNYGNFDARYQPKDNYATQAWVLQNFVQNIRQSGVAYIDAEKNSGQRLVPAGGVLIGSQVNGEWDNNEGFYYTWIQQNINGNWLTIGRV